MTASFNRRRSLDYSLLVKVACLELSANNQPELIQSIACRHPDISVPIFQKGHTDVRAHAILCDENLHFVAKLGNRLVFEALKIGNTA